MIAPHWISFCVKIPFFKGFNMKSIFWGLLGLIAVFLFNPISAKEAPRKKEVAENFLKSMPAHEQKMIRIIAYTKSIYLAAPDYKGLTTIIVERAYPDYSQRGNLVDVEISVSTEDPKIAVFTLKSDSCPAGLQSMQNNFIKLNVISNASNIQCSPGGYVIKSDPLDK